MRRTREMVSADRAIFQARVTENSLTPRGFYLSARYDFPTAGQFGKADYIDTHGREYRLAFGSKTDGKWKSGVAIPPLTMVQREKIMAKGTSSNGFRYWVRRPHAKGHEHSPVWFTPDEINAGVITLQPVATGLNSIQLKIVTIECNLPQKRTTAVRAIVVPLIH
jgi:hypothetical protein